MDFPITSIVSDPGTGQAIIRTAVLAGLLEHIDFDLATVNQRITFSHDILRDYFAALHIATRIAEGNVDLKTEYLEYHRWDEPLCMFAEMCDNKDDLVSVTSEIAGEDCLFAAQFALRGLDPPPTLLLSLMRGVGFIHTEIHHVLLPDSPMSMPRA